MTCLFQKFSQILIILDNYMDDLMTNYYFSAVGEPPACLGIAVAFAIIEATMSAQLDAAAEKPRFEIGKANK